MLWLFKKRVHDFLRSSLWVMPASAALAAVLLAPLIRHVDKTLGWQFFGFSSPGARGVAVIIAGTMLSFIVFFFSVLLVTVQIASGTLSPRIIARPFRSRTLKAAMALFVFTLTYGIAVVARATDNDTGQLAVVLLAVLYLISICVFLFIVEYVGKQLRPVTVLSKVGEEGQRVIRAEYPELLENSEKVSPRAALLPKGERLQTILNERHSGVVLAIDVRHLVEIAVQNGCAIELVPEVGDFVASGDPVFRLYGGHELPSKQVLQCIALGPERTMEQDPAFAFRIIVDIGIKALSPAINDPTTATLALDQIHLLLREVGKRRLDTGLIYDKKGHLRLVYNTPDWEDFVKLGVTEIRECGASSVQVPRRMRAMFLDLIRSLPPCRVGQIEQELQLLDGTIEKGFLSQDRDSAAMSDFQGMGGRGRTA